MKILSNIPFGIQQPTAITIARQTSTILYTSVSQAQTMAGILSNKQSVQTEVKEALETKEAIEQFVYQTVKICPKIGHSELPLVPKNPHQNIAYFRKPKPTRPSGQKPFDISV